MPSLLETARAVRFRSEKKRTRDEMDLAIAWLKREITTSQLRKAMLKSGSTGALVWSAITLRAAYKAGKITVA